MKATMTAGPAFGTASAITKNAGADGGTNTEQRQRPQPSEASSLLPVGAAATSAIALTESIPLHDALASRDRRTCNR